MLDALISKELFSVDTSQWLESVIDVTAQVTTRMLLSTFRLVIRTTTNSFQGQN